MGLVFHSILEFLDRCRGDFPALAHRWRCVSAKIGFEEQEGEATVVAETLKHGLLQATAM